MTTYYFLDQRLYDIFDEKTSLIFNELSIAQSFNLTNNVKYEILQNEDKFMNDDEILIDSIEDINYYLQEIMEVFNLDYIDEYMIVSDSIDYDQKWYKMPGSTTLILLNVKQRKEYEDYYNKKYCSLNDNDRENFTIACHIEQSDIHRISTIYELEEFVKTYHENDSYDKYRIQKNLNLLEDFDYFIDRNVDYISDIEHLELVDLFDYFDIDDLDLYDEVKEFSTFFISDCQIHFK